MRPKLSLVLSIKARTCATSATSVWTIIALRPSASICGLDLFYLILALVRVFRQHHISACLRQPKRDRPANPLRGSGDDGNLVHEPEA